MAVALHGVTGSGVIWLATQREPVAEPAIPIDLLIEEQPGPAPGAPPEAAPVPPPTAEAPPAPARTAPPRARTLRPSPSRVDAPRHAERAPGAEEAAAAEAPQASATAAVAPASRVFGEGEVDAVAAPLAAIEPRYPPREQQLGREGVVVLEVLVEGDGSVREARVVKSGGAGFDGAARGAVPASPFRAARRAGEAVASRVRVRVHFELD